MTTSSALPAALERYARVGGAAAARLDAEAGRLGAILDRFASRCTEYRVAETEGLAERLRAAARQQAELAAWTGEVARFFRAADSGALARADAMRAAAVDWLVSSRLYTALLPPGLGAYLELARTSPEYQEISWETIAFLLDANLATIELFIMLSGPAWPIYIPHFIQILGPSMIMLALAAGATIIASEWSRWLAEPIRSPDDLLDLLRQSFWNLSYRSVSNERMMSIMRRLDNLNRSMCGVLGNCIHARPPEHAEPLRDPVRGIRDVALEDVFDASVIRHRGSDGRLYISPQAAMHGAHSLISDYHGEQVRMTRVDERSFAIGISGLDMANARGPNNFTSVGLTAQGLTSDPRVGQQTYYTYVRTQFLGQLQRMPEGSTLHLLGHSMGGGMIMLLLNDPEVQRQILAAGITVASVTTFGAVRPNHPRANGVPPEERNELDRTLFANTIVNHYVDRDDALAHNVGAGHDPRRFANVHILDDGRITGPEEAHNSYERADYRDLPPEAQVLPFTINPIFFEVFDTFTPIETVECQPVTNAPPPVPRPTPLPAGLGAPGSPERIPSPTIPTPTPTLPAHGASAPSNNTPPTTPTPTPSPWSPGASTPPRNPPPPPVPTPTPTPPQ